MHEPPVFCRKLDAGPLQPQLSGVELKSPQLHAQQWYSGTYIIRGLHGSSQGVEPRDEDKDEDVFSIQILDL